MKCCLSSSSTLPWATSVTSITAGTQRTDGQSAHAAQLSPFQTAARCRSRNRARCSLSLTYLLLLCSTLTNFCRSSLQNTSPLLFLTAETSEAYSRLWFQSICQRGGEKPFLINPTNNPAKKTKQRRRRLLLNPFPAPPFANWRAREFSRSPSRCSCSSRHGDASFSHLDRDGFFSLLSRGLGSQNGRLYP